MSTKRDVHLPEYWSSRSEAYERSWAQEVFVDPITRAVLDLVAIQGMPEVLVDLGCGTGRLLRMAAARWPTARRIGVDPAAGMIAIARKMTPDATFYEEAPNGCRFPIRPPTSSSALSPFGSGEIRLRACARLSECYAREGASSLPTSSFLGWRHFWSRAFRKSEEGAGIVLRGNCWSGPSITG